MYQLVWFSPFTLTVLLEKENNNSIMASTNLNKSPPIFKEGDSHEKWKSKLEVCRSFANIEKTKQGLAIALLTLLNEAAEDAVLQLDKSHEEGMNNIIKVLDKIYLRDKTLYALIQHVNVRKRS